MHYSSKPVSLAVHRVGDTLLLDSAEHVVAAMRAARAAGTFPAQPTASLAGPSDGCIRPAPLCYDTPLEELAPSSRPAGAQQLHARQPAELHQRSAGSYACAVSGSHSTSPQQPAGASRLESALETPSRQAAAPRPLRPWQHEHPRVAAQSPAGMHTSHQVAQTSSAGSHAMGLRPLGAAPLSASRLEPAPATAESRRPSVLLSEVEGAEAAATRALVLWNSSDPDLAHTQRSPMDEKGAEPSPAAAQAQCGADWEASGLPMVQRRTGLEVAEGPHREEETDSDAREERRWAPPRSAQGAGEGQPFVESNQLFEWKLDSLRLVVESQLVLYRNPFKQPMSLKLVNVDERVTMLTCLSAWLDNIFAGVPELAVCYHRDGAVKGYEMIKTEGIPYLCEPNFEPAEVLEFGRTILGFLQSNCTTDNATYWLLRDASSDQVQLFDVSALLGKGQGGGGGDETQRTVAAPPAPGMDPASLPALPEGGSKPVSSSSMGILCLRLAEKLPQAPTSAASQEVLHRDKWLLLQRAATLIDPSQHPAKAASALHEMGLLLLHPGAEALSREFLTQDDAAGEQPGPLRLRLPPSHEEHAGAGLGGGEGQRAGARSALPPLFFTGSLFGGSDSALGAPQAATAESGACAQGPSTSEQLWAARGLLRRARKVLTRGFSDGVDVTSSDADPLLGERVLRLACQEGACCFDLARRCYLDGSLGEALALAQAAWELCPESPAALALLGDLHAALRVAVATPAATAADRAHPADPCGDLVAQYQRYMAELQRPDGDAPTRADDGHPAVEEAGPAAGLGQLRRGPQEDPSWHRTAAIAHYEAAIKAALAAQMTVTPTLAPASDAAATGEGLRRRSADGQIRPPPAPTVGDRLARWETAGFSAGRGGSCDTVERGLSRRLASLYNELAQHALQAAMRAGPQRMEECARSFGRAEAAFRVAADQFGATSDAVNAGLVARNLAYTLRQRSVLLLPAMAATVKSAAGAAVGPATGGGVSNPAAAFAAAVAGAAVGADAQLAAYVSGQELCRGGLRGLRRREAQPEVWDLLQAELAQCTLARGVLTLHIDGSAPASASFRAATAAVSDAASIFQALGPAGASDAAVAHFHAGRALADAVLSQNAAAARPASGGGVSAAAGGARWVLPARHLEKAMGFFTAASYPKDHLRIRVTLARLQEDRACADPSRAVAALERATGMLIACAPALRVLEGGADSRGSTALDGAEEIGAEALECLLSVLRAWARAAGGRVNRPRAAFEVALRGKIAIQRQRAEGAAGDGEQEGHAVLFERLGQLLSSSPRHAGPHLLQQEQ